jgi:hypothetical protein
MLRRVVFHYFHIHFEKKEKIEHGWYNIMYSDLIKRQKMTFNRKATFTIILPYVC